MITVIPMGLFIAQRYSQRSSDILTAAIDEHPGAHLSRRTGLNLNGCRFRRGFALQPSVQEINDFGKTARGSGA